MTRQIISVLFVIAFIFTGCASSQSVEIPTQIVLPTDAPTATMVEPTQTALPTDTPAPRPTDLVIPNTAASNPNDQAFVRVIHASPDLGVMDVYIEALAIATNMGFESYTEKQGIVAGDYNLRILPTGGLVTDTPIYEQSITISGNDSLIFLISAEGENVKLTILSEPNNPLPGQTTRLLQLNAVEGASNMVMLVDNVPQTTVTPYLQLSETTEYATGTANFTFQNAGQTLFETSLDLRSRQNYIFLLLGQLDRPDTLQLRILSSQAPGQTTVRFINASKSVGLVDLYFGDQRFIAGADYSEISVPSPILSGTYNVQLYPEQVTPGTQDPLTGTQFIANPDDDVVMILVGDVGSLQFVLYRNNTEPTYDNRARIAFVHALTGVPSILLSSTNPDLEMRLSYGRVSDTFEIDVDQTIGFTWIQQLDDSQDVALETYSDFTPVAGQNYIYLFTGSGYDPPVILSIPVGTSGFDYAEADDITNVTTTRPTRLRFINLWDDQQFTVRLDGTVIAEGIDYGTATNEIIITGGEHNIIFHDFTTDAEIIEIQDEFDVASEYLIVTYTLANDEGAILNIDVTDDIPSSASAGIRLIVLEANADSLFGIGYSESSPNISQPDSTENFRRSIPLGVQQIIRDIPTGTVSAMQRIPAGTYNIRIIDNEEGAIAYTHAEYTIEAQTLYNVFLRENSRTVQTSTLIIPYSTR